MSRMIIETGMPLRLAATPWSNRLGAVVVLGAIMMTIGFAFPSAGMSANFIDEKVPQIATGYGP